MWQHFGFYLPDAQYLKDPEGLVKYLVGAVWCSQTGGLGACHSTDGGPHSVAQRGVVLGRAPGGCWGWVRHLLVLGRALNGC